MHNLVRVQDLARSMGVPSRDLVEVLRSFGYRVRSHASQLRAEEAARVRALVFTGRNSVPTTTPAMRRTRRAAA